VVLSPRKVRPRILTTLTLAALLAAVSGCSGQPAVKGHASVDNKPLSSGSVRFIPDKDKGNTATAEPRGVITEQGTYEVATDGRPGAPPGWYKVVVAAVEPVDLNNPSPPPAKSLIAVKYNQPETTDLHVEVKAGAADGAYDLKLSGPGRDSALPGAILPMPGIVR
jgi:hypothetical protein